MNLNIIISIAGHLSGEVPGVLLAIIYIILVFSCHQILNIRLDDIISTLKTVSDLDEKSKAQLVETTYEFRFFEKFSSWIRELSWEKLGYYVKFFLILGVFNFIVVLVMNVLYIVAYLNSSTSKTGLFFTAWALAIFKITW